MGKLITLLVVMLLGAGAGVGVYIFVLAPKLNPEKASETHEEELGDKIPPGAKTIAFDESIATVISSNKDVPAPLLMFGVSMLCANEETFALVEADKEYFKSMLARLHSYKRREELNDPLVQENIEREALRKANERLAKLQDKPKSDIKILEVYHTKFAVVDQ